MGSATSKSDDDTEEYLIGTFVGEISFPISSEFWHKLLDLPLNLRHHHNHNHNHNHSPADTNIITNTNTVTDRLLQACHALAQNNHRTRHLAKLLIHLACSLQECVSSSDTPTAAVTKAMNAAYLSSVFLKHTIENAKTENYEELHLNFDENEVETNAYLKGQSIEFFLMHSVLTFVGTVKVSSLTYLLHYELHYFMMVAMSTQLLSGSSPGPKDAHPFVDALMAQEPSLIASVVRRLLLNYLHTPKNSFSEASYLAFSGNQHGVLQKVGSAAASLVLFPLNLFTVSNTSGSQSLLASSSLHVLLILVHFRKCDITNDNLSEKSFNNASSDSLCKERTNFVANPYCKALEHARDIEYDPVDIEGNAYSDAPLRVPFAFLFDTLGMSLADESSALLLYSLVHGNAHFLEYVFVRTDLDTLLMPILETLYNAPKRTPNQIYMLLIILLILSQDSTFNASIHKLVLPSVPWYQERRIHHISLGSLIIIILIRTVKYNLSRLRDVYLHTNCLGTLANMAPHVHHLDAYASQRLVGHFHMLSRKYTKLAERQNDKIQTSKVNSFEGDGGLDDVSIELHIYTDFLRIVLEIINSILTYAMPRNPEVVYAIMHRQEVFLPFRSHPRFNELLENIFTVIDFFNIRMDARDVDGEWSVEKAFKVITDNCRSWRGEGMKLFTQLRFTYEQESHPEEFFIPYVWQLALSNCKLAFDANKINLFPVHLIMDGDYDGDKNHKHPSDVQNGFGNTEGSVANVDSVV